MITKRVNNEVAYLRPKNELKGQERRLKWERGD